MSNHCRGACESFPKGLGPLGGYHAGLRFCSYCVYFTPLATCLCCSGQTRTRPRNRRKEYRAKLRETRKESIAIVQF